jgi:hypothetical protein
MYVRWAQQSQGFNQATYPCKNYNLSASLVEIKVGEEGEEESVTSLGSVTVEENARGQFKFLFGSQQAFWSGVQDKLQGVGLTSEQIEDVRDSLAVKIPIPR